MRRRRKRKRRNQAGHDGGDAVKTKKEKEKEKRRNEGQQQTKQKSRRRRRKNATWMGRDVAECDGRRKGTAERPVGDTGSTRDCDGCHCDDFDDCDDCGPGPGLGRQQTAKERKCACEREENDRHWCCGCEHEHCCAESGRRDRWHRCGFHCRFLACGLFFSSHRCCCCYSALWQSSSSASSASSASSLPSGPFAPSARPCSSGAPQHPGAVAPCGWMSQMCLKKQKTKWET
mmetsp:Transcript_36938/g.92597  ORF Transcript_36938/g.92597 Transcript_36938/m.92597 type:complete len:232 (+) Transcript_36938:2552-3247(+)